MQSSTPISDSATVNGDAYFPGANTLPGGGTVTGSIGGGCIYAGPNAQQTTSPTSWVVGQSEFVTRTVDITNGNAVRVTFQKLGYKGTFTQSTAGGDPTVTC